MEGITTQLKDGVNAFWVQGGQGGVITAEPWGEVRKARLG